MKFDEKHAKVERQVIEYLTKRKFKEASLTVAAYEAEQTHPRGIGIDWKHYNSNHDIEMLKTIFESKPPKIIVRLGNEKLEAVRIAAAMMALWGTSTAKRWLPANFETGLRFDNDTVVRMVNFQAANEGALDRYEKEGIDMSELYNAPDACDECVGLAGVYDTSECHGMLPYEHCTHKMGCRCIFLPVV